jgi:hypothetical protein
MLLSMEEIEWSSSPCVLLLVCCGDGHDGVRGVGVIGNTIVTSAMVAATDIGESVRKIGASHKNGSSGGKGGLVESCGGVLERGE